MTVPVISGNHDQTRIFYTGHALHCWFRNTPDVTIDNGFQTRKYFCYGRNLIGFCHGHLEPHANLPLIMATEQKEAWSTAKFLEWHVGHWHTRKRKVFLPLEDQHGVVVRVIPSLCPPNAWAKSMGYLGQRAATAIFWDPEQGPVAEFLHAP